MRALQISFSYSELKLSIKADDGINNDGRVVYVVDLGKVDIDDSNNINYDNNGKIDGVDDSNNVNDDNVNAVVVGKVDGVGDGNSIKDDDISNIDCVGYSNSVTMMLMIMANVIVLVMLSLSAKLMCW